MQSGKSFLEDVGGGNGEKERFRQYKLLTMKRMPVGNREGGGKGPENLGFGLTHGIGGH